LSNRVVGLFVVVISMLDSGQIRYK